MGKSPKITATDLIVDWATQNISSQLASANKCFFFNTYLKFIIYIYFKGKQFQLNVKSVYQDSYQLSIELCRVFLLEKHSMNCFLCFCSIEDEFHFNMSKCEGYRKTTLSLITGKKINV